ncbi:hypothetical protein SHLI107390_03070 [Shewanella livingstonensis]
MLVGYGLQMYEQVITIGFIFAIDAISSGQT